MNFLYSLALHSPFLAHLGQSLQLPPASVYTFGRCVQSLSSFLAAGLADLAAFFGALNLRLCACNAFCCSSATLAWICLAFARTATTAASSNSFFSLVSRSSSCSLSSDAMACALAWVYVCPAAYIMKRACCSIPIILAAYSLASLRAFFSALRVALASSTRFC